MGRLIDADVMRDDWLEKGENEYVYDTNSLLNSIDSQPTVDAVEVVRCKDCRHWDSETGWCNKNSAFDDHDMDWNIYNDCDFCSYGERRTGGQVH